MLLNPKYMGIQGFIFFNLCSSSPLTETAGQEPPDPLNALFPMCVKSFIRRIVHSMAVFNKINIFAILRAITKNILTKNLETLKN